MIRTIGSNLKKVFVVGILHSKTYSILRGNSYTQSL